MACPAGFCNAVSTSVIFQIEWLTMQCLSYWPPLTAHGYGELWQNLKQIPGRQFCVELSAGDYPDCFMLSGVTLSWWIGVWSLGSCMTIAAYQQMRLPGYYRIYTKPSCCTLNLSFWSLTSLTLSLSTDRWHFSIWWRCSLGIMWRWLTLVTHCNPHNAWIWATVSGKPLWHSWSSISRRQSHSAWPTSLPIQNWIAPQCLASCLATPSYTGTPHSPTPTVSAWCHWRCVSCQYFWHMMQRPADTAPIPSPTLPIWRRQCSGRYIGGWHTDSRWQQRSVRSLTQCLTPATPVSPW